jgi:hypothetical protein
MRSNCLFPDSNSIEGTPLTPVSTTTTTSSAGSNDGHPELADLDSLTDLLPPIVNTDMMIKMDMSSNESVETNNWDSTSNSSASYLSVTPPPPPPSSLMSSSYPSHLEFACSAPDVTDLLQSDLGVSVSNTEAEWIDNLIKL